MKKACLILPALFFSTASFGQFKNVTGEFTSFFNERFVGQISQGSLTWDNVKCIVPNLSGGCVEHAGNKIEGTGTGWVSENLRVDGKGWMLQQNQDPWTNESFVQNFVDISMHYKYEGKTVGKKQCFPGNFFCGYEWGEVNPEGRIIIDVEAGRGNEFQVDVRYEVLPGHPSRANQVIADAMHKLKPKARDIIQTFVRRNGSDANVVLK